MKHTSEKCRQCVADKLYASLSRRTFINCDWTQRKSRRPSWKIITVLRAGPEHAIVLASHRDAPREYAVFWQPLKERAIPTDSFAGRLRDAKEIFKFYVEKTKEEGLSWDSIV